jgi:hypothetical protein
MILVGVGHGGIILIFAIRNSLLYIFCAICVNVYGEWLNVTNMCF